MIHISALWLDSEISLSVSRKCWMLKVQKEPAILPSQIMSTSIFHRYGSWYVSNVASPVSPEEAKEYCFLIFSLWCYNVKLLLNFPISSTMPEPEYMQRMTNIVRKGKYVSSIVYMVPIKSVCTSLCMKLLNCCFLWT